MKPTLTDFLSLLFRPGEFTTYAKNAEGTRVFAVEKPPVWVQYFSINPLDGERDRSPDDPEKHSVDRPRRADANVTAYRNFLVEVDPTEENPMTLEQQLEYVRGSGMPYTTVVFSGKKSYHFVIALEESLASHQEYTYVATWLLNVMRLADQSTKNPSRLSRFPGVVRDATGQVQELVETRQRVSAEELYAFLSRFPDFQPEPDPERGDVKLPEGEKGRISRRTRRFLMFGAEAGKRNNELHQAARDMHQNGWTIEESWDLLYEAMKDEPDFSEKEFRSTVRGAFRKPPKFAPRI